MSLEIDYIQVAYSKKFIDDVVFTTLIKKQEFGDEEDEKTTLEDFEPGAKEQKLNFLKVVYKQPKDGKTTFGLRYIGSRIKTKRTTRTESKQFGIDFFRYFGCEIAEAK